MEYILNFIDVDKNSLSQVGGKNSSLGEMIKAGIRVPPGFAVTTDSYLSFIIKTEIKDKIYNILSDLNPDDVETLNKASAEVQRMINDVKSSDSRIQITGYVKEIVENDYIILNDKTGDIKVDIKDVEFPFNKNDLINAIGELNITMGGEKEVGAEIIQDKNKLNFEYYQKLYEIKKELKLV